jgi:hypothetical protein
MSNIPTPKAIASFIPQIAGTLKSILLATHDLLRDNDNYADLRVTYLQFYSNPIFQLVLGIPTQQPSPPTPTDNQLQAELKEIKSTLSALSKAMNGQQPKAKGAKAPIF